jgi:carboxylesterase type B
MTIDWIFNCNTRYLTNAYDNNTYNYRFSLRPGIHAADLFLTFLDVKIDWQGKRRVVNVPYARAWQSYLVSFIKHGNPNVQRREETIRWETAGEDIRIVDLRWEGFKWVEDDQVDAERCAFWQKAEYAPYWNSSA